MSARYNLWWGNYLPSPDVGTALNLWEFWGSFQMEEWICESPRYNFSDLLTYLPFSTFFATFAIYYFGEEIRSFGGKKSPFRSCLTKFLIKLCRISNISNRFFCRACRWPCSRSRGVWDPWTTSKDSWGWCPRHELVLFIVIEWKKVLRSGQLLS